MPSPRPTEVTRAVIDIGSNSVRMVVYAGPERLPWPVLNEKIPAALGRTIAEDGMIPAKAMDLAVAGLARFACLLAAMKVPTVKVVATAAARDARNGAEFLDRVRALGLTPELLTGEQEAAGSAMGILSAFPDADGIVGDLGGGSVELVGVGAGRIGRGASFPLGTLRLPKLRAGGGERFDRAVATMLGADDWAGAAEGRSFYCVGGSWRALAHVDLHDAGSPLFDPQAHGMAPQRLAELARMVEELPPKKLKDIPGVSATRAASMADATALLTALVRRLRPERLIFSSFGLREGLLYGSLSPAARLADPLAGAVRDLTARSGGDLVFGDAVAKWIAPVFAAEPAGDRRVLEAACALATIGLQSERAWRARRGVELALHERWAGIDARGRAMLARALHGATGEKEEVAGLDRLASAGDLARAATWGLALRFAARLSGSSPPVIARTTLGIDGDRLVLRLPGELMVLYGGGVEQAHEALANAMGKQPIVTREREPAPAGV